MIIYMKYNNYKTSQFLNLVIRYLSFWVEFSIPDFMTYLKLL